MVYLTPYKAYYYRQHKDSAIQQHDESSKEKRLNDMLLNNSARRVLKYLKNHDYVTKDEIGYIINDVKASEFHSKKTAVISDGRIFQDELAGFMLEKGYICEAKIKGRRVYVLPEKNK